LNIITFPGLNLKFNIYRIALRIGSIQIYWYAIFIVLSFIISLIIFKNKNGKFGIKYLDILDLFIILIPTSIICARIYYIIFNLNYYVNNPIQIINIRNGGLAIYGGIIGGIITCYLFCKKRKIDFLNLLDYIAPCLALGQSIGRWGNFVNIEAYGSKTNLPWRMGIIENGNYTEVHPTFLYESIATLIIFIILTTISKKRKFKGEITYLYLIMYSFIRTIIENLRTDSLMLGKIRVSAILSIIIFIFANIMYWKTKKIKTNEYN
jgi:phosphatidylglycerol:prolipoprotein diacylglycerol transferase